MAKCCLSAVALSIAISPSSLGHSPPASCNGFRLWSPDVSAAMAIPSSALPIGLPLASSSRAEPSIEPWTTCTPGSASTRRATLAEKAGASVSPSWVLIACFEVMIASVFLYDSS